MTRSIFSGRLLGLLDVFGSALSATSSNRRHHKANPHYLVTSGVDAEQFRQINRL